MTDAARSTQTKTAHIQCDGVELDGLLTLPASAAGIVLFAHGSGSSRFSPRNTSVACGLQAAGLGTLLFDLLTEHEAADRARVFDVTLLARRLCAARDWIRDHESTRRLAIGYFGASTGAAAALIAAADDREIRAIVSRGGRPDMAGAALPKVMAPTLLIVGGDDTTVLDLNEQAYARLQCKKELKIVPGASHLFEEPGTLDEVLHLATEWFARYLKKVHREPR